MDCDDEDASVGAAQAEGTACDDGDATTENDVILSDGCTCAGTPIITMSDIVINEFMASNEITVADQDGEYEDWIELYNNGTQSVDLSGYYLTDDASDLMLWSFPEGTTLAPDSYLIIWADDDEDQEGLHASFKLLGSGEQILLVDADGTSILDAVSYPEQSDDVSYGRFPNGVGDFQEMDPTFNAENIGTTTSISNPNLESVDISIYPNPVQSILNLEIHDQGAKSLTIYDLTGKVVYQNSVSGQAYIDVSSWVNGMYIVKAENTFVKIIKQ